jgi:hypothetical protein
MHAMTTDKIREKAVQMLNSRANGRRLAASIIQLKDGTSFTGVLMERATKPDKSDAEERLGFTLSDDEIRYFPINDIASL